MPLYGGVEEVSGDGLGVFKNARLRSAERNVFRAPFGGIGRVEKFLHGVLRHLPVPEYGKSHRQHSSADVFIEGLQRLRMPLCNVQYEIVDFSQLVFLHISSGQGESPPS